ATCRVIVSTEIPFRYELVSYRVNMHQITHTEDDQDILTEMKAEMLRYGRSRSIKHL
ncbi:hypothetical protein NPIL_322791, partial [Nephila pilipes]